jgi:hypothetical protein
MITNIDNNAGSYAAHSGTTPSIIGNKHPVLAFLVPTIPGQPVHNAMAGGTVPGVESCPLATPLPLDEPEGRCLNHNLI